MKILIISQYFWPENFRINDIALGLKELGHEVIILTGLPNYPHGKLYDGYSNDGVDEYWNGIKVYRCRIIPRGSGGLKLFLNYISFVWYGYKKVNKIEENVDRILVYEPSPITVGLPAIHASKKLKAPYYFWVQDLWPHSLSAAGGVNNPFVLGVFEVLTRYIYKKSKKVLVQSRGFKTYIEKQGVPSDKILFFPNSTEEFYAKMPPSNVINEKLPKGFIIMFAGNLGEAQSLNTLIDTAILVKEINSDVKWCFLGDGRAKDKISKKVSDLGLNDTIFFLGSYPPSEMPIYFASADVLIASLKDDPIFALTIPSKIQSYLACGKPILASLNGEGAKIIEEAQCGYVSQAEDSSMLAENVLKMYNISQSEREIMGSNAIQYFNQNFERNMLLRQLVDILLN